PLVIETVLPVELSPVPPITMSSPATLELLTRATAPEPVTELASKSPPAVTFKLTVVPERLVTDKGPLPAVASAVPVAVTPEIVKPLEVVVAAKLPTLPVAVTVPDIDPAAMEALAPLALMIN